MAVDHNLGREQVCELNIEVELDLKPTRCRGAEYNRTNWLLILPGPELDFARGAQWPLSLARACSASGSRKGLDACGDAFGLFGGTGARARTAPEEYDGRDKRDPKLRSHASHGRTGTGALSARILCPNDPRTDHRSRLAIQAKPSPVCASSEISALLLTSVAGSTFFCRSRIDPQDGNDAEHDDASPTHAASNIGRR